MSGVHFARKKTKSTSHPSSGTLTPKQAEILQFLEEHLSETGRPPTLRQIASHFGYQAVGTVEDHLKALEKKGYLSREKGLACGITLAHQAPARHIPVLGTVPAGNPIEAIQDSRGSLSWSGAKAGDSLFALTVRGESMKDAGILPGDQVIVSTNQEARHGDIVVALIDGEATVKRLEKKGGRVRLLPENSAFSPIELDPSRENLIQGKVVGLQRKYE